MKTLSIGDVTRLVGIGGRTLRRWTGRGVVHPKAIQVGRRRFFLWTPADVAKLKKWAAGHKFEGRGRKPKGRAN